MRGARYGVVSYADTLDCVGIMASEVDDAQLLFGTFSHRVFDAMFSLTCLGWIRADVMSHPDPKDPSCASLEVRDRSEGVEYEARRSLKGLQDRRLDGVRVGIPIVRAQSEECIQLKLNTTTNCRKHV